MQLVPILAVSNTDLTDENSIGNSVTQRLRVKYEAKLEVMMSSKLSQREKRTRKTPKFGAVRISRKKRTMRREDLYKTAHEH